MDLNTNDFNEYIKNDMEGGVASVSETTELFQNFLDDTASVEQSGGVESVETTELFQNFLDDTASVEQSGGVASVEKLNYFKSKSWMILQALNKVVVLPCRNN